jgi:hypothetical protein
MAIKNIFESLKDVIPNIDNLSVDDLKKELADYDDLLLWTF